MYVKSKLINGYLGLLNNKNSRAPPWTPTRRVQILYALLANISHAHHHNSYSDTEKGRHFCFLPWAPRPLATPLILTVHSLLFNSFAALQVLAAYNLKAMA